MASPEHQQLVATLSAVGTVLTPTEAPTPEALLEDSRRFVARATAAGAHVRYIGHPDVAHMWMVMAPDLPESCQAFDAAAQFLRDLT